MNISKTQKSNTKKLVAKRVTLIAKNIDKLDDLALIKIIKARKGGKTIAIKLEDL